jgi:anti-anti-sigma factor
MLAAENIVLLQKGYPVTGSINVGEREGIHIICFEGDIRVGLCSAFDNYCKGMLGDKEFVRVIVDLRKTKGIDSTALGSLARLSMGVKASKGCVPTLICNTPNIKRILQNMGFDDVFDIVPEAHDTMFETQILPTFSDLALDGTREKVIEAHRLLMEMNDANKHAFKNLVDALELEALNHREATND